MIENGHTEGTSGVGGKFLFPDQHGHYKYFLPYEHLLSYIFDLEGGVSFCALFYNKVN